jgi:hypothetical protein
MSSPRKSLIRLAAVYSRSSWPDVQSVALLLLDRCCCCLMRSESELGPLRKATAAAAQIASIAQNQQRQLYQWFSAEMSHASCDTNELPSLYAARPTDCLLLRPKRVGGKVRFIWLLLLGCLEEQTALPDGRKQSLRNSLFSCSARAVK